MGGEKKRKRKRRRREEKRKAKPKRYGNFFEYGFCMDHMDFVWDSRKVYEFQI